MSDTDDMESRLLTVSEAAALLNVRPGWLYGLTRLGSKSPIPHLRIGRYVRFERQAVLDWIAQQRLGGATTESRTR